MKLPVLHRNFKLMIIVFVALIPLAIAGNATVNLIATFFDLSDQKALLDKSTAGVFVEDDPLEHAEIQDDFQQIIFDGISVSCEKHGVRLKQINALKISDQNNLQMLTQEAVLEGGFVSILRALQETRTLKGIKVVSLAFELEESNKVETLVARICFQGVKALEHE